MVQVLTEKHLHSYQWKAIDHGMKWFHAGLFLDMGLGKTVIALMISMKLIKAGKVRRVLIVAPKMVCTEVWADEHLNWEQLKHLRLTMIAGLSPPKRKLALRNPGKITIVNYELFDWLIKYQNEMGNWPFDMVIYDELSKMKNHTTNVCKAAKLLRTSGVVTRTIGMTGTPATSGLKNLWAQIWLLDKGRRLLQKISWFDDTFFDNYSNSHNYKKLVPKRGTETLILSLLSDLCLSMRARDYLDLPKVTYKTIFVEPSARAKVMYKELEKETLVMIGEGKMIDASNETVMQMKLRQICSGAVYLTDPETEQRLPGDEFEVVCDAKLHALSKILDNAGDQPVLVAYEFKHDLIRMKEFFIKRYPNCEDFRNIKNAKKKWNDGEIPLMFIHPKSAGHGLNLQYGGSVLVWYALTWSLDNFLQTVARLDRQGQTKAVFIYTLAVKSSVETKVAARLASNQVTHNNVMSLLR